MRAKILDFGIAKLGLDHVRGSRLLPNLLLTLRGLLAKVLTIPQSLVRYVTIRSASPKGLFFRTMPSVL